MTPEQVRELERAWDEFVDAFNARRDDYRANGGKCAPETQARAFRAERALMWATDYPALLASAKREEVYRGALERIAKYRGQNAPFLAAKARAALAEGEGS